MKDASDKLYSAIYSLLAGNVTYGGEQINVYSVVPQSVQNDYIYLANTNFNEANAKDRFTSNGTIQIQIVTRFDHDGFTNKKLNSIVNQVKNLLKPTVTSAPSLSPTFNATFFYLESELKDYSLEQVENASRTILIFRIEIEEL